MTNLNFIGALVVLFLCAVIIGIRIYKNKYRNITSIDDIISSYGEQIIAVLQDTIVILSIDMKDYESKEEYEEAIISTTINVLKENSIEFGIPFEIIDLVNTEGLTNIVMRVLDNEKPECFSILGVDTIFENKKIMDQKVIDVFDTAKE